MDFILGILVGSFVAGFIELFFEKMNVTVHTFNFSDKTPHYESYFVSYKRGFNLKSGLFVRVSKSSWYNQNTGELVNDCKLNDALENSYRACCFEKGVSF